MISDKLKSVTQRMAKACGKADRPSGSAVLVCVTKEASIDEMREALSLGVRIFGENRVQNAAAKYAQIREKAEWHMIGHLQSNKVKDAVRIFSLIHSVDSVKLAKVIDKEAARCGKIQDILLQVNISGEESKSGVSAEAAESTVDEILLCRNLKLRGLMTMAPENDDPETARPYFKRLRELRNSINDGIEKSNILRELSMGMTNDFEAAIEEGATLVRIGRAVFK